ncbi:MAG TPA: M23 family metallopeptidase [Thermomonas sp.]|nr:M23 family metallopeptidase [Thermomonas sp.]
MILPKVQRGGAVRGTLLFLLGLLTGANLVYYALTRGGSRPDAAPASLPAPAAGSDHATPAPEVPAPAGEPAPGPTPSAAPGAAAPAIPPPIAPGATLPVPVQGVAPAQLQDTFTDARSAGRSHDAIDIMAPAGTPVLAVADGTVEKLFESRLGGTTLYQFNAERTLAYYYAHLQAYAPGIAEGQALRRGQVIGYVGSTGNASPEAPHLHFAVFVLGPEKQWWKGEAVNPYPLLRGDAR